MRSLVLAIALAAVSGPVVAQSADQVQAIHIRDGVDQLLAQAGATELFENVSTSELGAARHHRSGLMCLFAPDDPLNLVVVYPSRPGGPAAGDDVSCRTGVGNSTFVTVYATRYPGGRSQDDLMNQAVTEIIGVWTDLSPLEGQYRVTSPSGHPSPLVYGFVGSMQGSRLRSFILVQNIGEWSFKGRASGPVDDPDVSVIGSWTFDMSLPGNWDARQMAQ